ncbi:uncharacterized protein LOC115664492 isoform X2 [Syzygium oleosum]|uniref:uncharacterized protein LOC115664492 isoform X2 n=1 Tax=Syzygium oleosum TaxID=219896 RepID=UPI0024B8F67D|nr:uncharacterized protein LOC115664492 isoform X2 [Syzygium oleosum]
MTGGPCQPLEERRMMGRGADGGCGAGERPCPVPRVPARAPADTAGEPAPPEEVVDFFSQARKALSQRSPFDAAEDGSAAGDGVPVPGLPCGLASLLKNSDSRKKHKKSHSGAEKKSSRQVERSRGCNIWLETDDFFRGLTLPDIDALYGACSVSSIASRERMLIPVLEGDNVEDNAVSCQDVDDCSGSGVVLEEEKQGRSEQDMEIDSVGAGGTPRQEAVCPASDSSGSLEWLLGCRNKIYLTSERPSKKRKLLGSDAGLQKLLIGHPCEGNSSVCSFCCKTESAFESNPLIICSSCKVAIHAKCYGVQGDVDGSWVCSWCKQKKGSGCDSGNACVLCPKEGGALKPVQRKEGSNATSEFAHLFCSQWMPEVYVEDLTKMEPIMNLEGIKETRRKLVCNVCKIKSGACVPCSHGTCRISFHPICAREASYRMEIWGNFGDDNVELRAFCSRHSNVRASGVSGQPEGCPGWADGNPQIENPVSGVSPTKETNSSKVGCKNGGDDSHKSDSTDLQEVVLSNDRSNINTKLESTDSEELGQLEKIHLSNCEDTNASDSLNFVLILKKLIDRGKVNVKDVASEIGISPDSFYSKLADNKYVPDLQWKLVKWLKNHACMGTSQKDLKVKKSSFPAKAEVGGTDTSDSVALSDSDISDPVAVKSVPPRRRTKSNIRISKDNNIICSSKNSFNDNRTVMDGLDQVVAGEVERSTELSIPDVSEKLETELDSSQNTIARDSPSLLAGPPNSSFSQCSQLEEAADLDPSTLAIPNTGNPVCPHQENPGLSNPVKSEALRSFYMHPYIQKSLLYMQSRGLLWNVMDENDGLKGGETSRVGSSCGASVCCDHQNGQIICNTGDCKSAGEDSESLVNAGRSRVLEMSPNDEVEGEILYFQRRLLGNAIDRKRYSDNLINKIRKDLPQEIDSAHGQVWDAVLVNKYLCELRVAKKLGRKERKHKEAQAVLAAATAAAAASSRISSLRKDLLDGSANQENLVKLNATSGRPGYCSQLMPRARETVPKVGVHKDSLERHSGSIQSASDFSKDHPKSCDICSRPETLMNSILVCSSCKVSVHMDCYRSVRESTGPWYCELCEELRSSGVPAVDFWEKFASAAECALCGGTTGAFRKCTDGKWVHAFCAEWVFEATFTRGQVNPVEGMDSISKGVDECNVCHHRFGVCIKCNYGHCQSTFHPSCARTTGLFMSVKTVGGKLQHRAYCGKHSVEQKAKAESQKYGIEELKSIKQIRVELERLRLLCERIIKREKVKREIVLSTHEILALKRNTVARSMLVQGPFLATDASSESATTSLNYRSGNEAVQKSDEMTVDSSVSIKRRSKVPSHTSTAQKTDGSPGSQTIVIRKPTEKAPFSGKHIPQRPPVASRNILNDGEVRSRYKKHPETFEKELVMTSDQADLKNKMLPKGYAYVPSDSIPKDKWISQDGSSEPLEDGG